MNDYIGFVILLVIGFICYGSGILLRYLIDRNNVAGIIELVRLWIRGKSK